jgi:hypothetical protein
MDPEKEICKFALKGYKMQCKLHSGQNSVATWLSWFEYADDVFKTFRQTGGIFDQTFSENVDKDKSIKSAIRKMKKYGY